MARITIAFVIAVLFSFAAHAAEPVGLAVLDLDAIGVSPTEALALSEKLRSSISTLILTSDTAVREQYSLLERSQMDKIFEQFNVQNSGCTDISCAVEFGKMLNVQQILIGSVSSIGQLYLVSLRIVDVGSSRILASKEGQVRGSIEDVVGLIDSVGREILTGEAAPTPQPQEPEKKPEPQEEIELPQERVETEKPSEPVKQKESIKPNYWKKIKKGGDVNVFGFYEKFITPSNWNDWSKNSGISVIMGYYFNAINIKIEYNFKNSNVDFNYIDEWNYKINHGADFESHQVKTLFVLEPYKNNTISPYVGLGFNKYFEFNLGYKNYYRCVEDEIYHNRNAGYVFRFGLKYKKNNFKYGFSCDIEKVSTIGGEDLTITIPKFSFERKLGNFVLSLNTLFLNYKEDYGRKISILRIMPGIGYTF